MATMSQIIKYKLPFRGYTQGIIEDVKTHGLIGAYKKRRSQEAPDERGVVGLAKSIVHRGKEMVGLKQTKGIIREKVTKILYGQHAPEKPATGKSTYQITRTLDQGQEKTVPMVVTLRP